MSINKNNDLIDIITMNIIKNIELTNAIRKMNIINYIYLKYNSKK